MSLGQAEINELMRRGLTRGGWNYSLRGAKLYLNPLTLPARKAAQVAAGAKKFADRLTREGWVILGPPLIYQPRVINESDSAPNVYSNRGGLWMPRVGRKEGTIPSDHPWVHHGEDLVFLSLPAKRRVQPTTMEIPDDVIEQWQDERDPVLNKLVVAT